MGMSYKEYEALHGVKLGSKLRVIFRKLVTSGKMTVAQFTETAEANNRMIEAICGTKL